MAAITTSTLTAGDTVTARPWVNSSEIEPLAGVFMGTEVFDNTEYLMVWFPPLGGFTSDDIGRAFQPILPAKATATGRTVADWPKIQVMRTARLCLAESGRADIAPLYQVLCRIIRARFW
jgi:hypothetical protein